MSFLSVLLLPGCAAKRQYPLHKHIVVEDVQDDAWKMVEAKLYDIPIPLQVQRLALSDVKEGGYKLVYRSKDISLEELVVWYNQEMESLGWQVDTTYTTPHSWISIFKKPTKQSIMYLVGENGFVHISLFYHEFTDQEMVHSEFV